MKKAINQWCFPENTPVSELVDESAKAGFWGLELNVNDAAGVGLTVETSTAEAKAVRKQLVDAGVQPSCLSTSLLWRTPLTAADESVATRGQAVVRKQIELAAALEVDTILVVPGVIRAGDDYEAGYRRSQDALAKLAETAAGAGVRIGVENVWNRFLISGFELKRFVDEINHPALGVYFDVGNALQFGSPQEWIQMLGQRIFKVHVKGFSQVVGNINGFVPLLAGDVEWPAVMQALQEIGYDDVLTAEISPYKTAPFQAVYDTSRQLDAILAM